MRTSQTLSFLLYTYLLISITFSQSTTTCNLNDKKVLLQIKAYFNNSSAFSSWTPDTDCCNWDGAGCNDLTNPDRVTSLLVAGFDDIVGELTPLVGDLPFLTRLQFFQLPNLTGPIPKAVTKLTKLQVLSLVLNSNFGPVPQFLSELKSLNFLDLSSNGFSGEIPSSLSLLSDLQVLNLQSNKLSGFIPESFGSFKQPAMILDLYNNELSGPIPKSLGRVNFQSLNLARNHFIGDATFLFGKNKPLHDINLSHNLLHFNFTNVKPPTGLHFLDISHNKIYGSIPNEISELKSLTSIDVSFNQLCGKIPKTGPKTTFFASSFSHNKCLCGAPLSSCK